MSITTIPSNLITLTQALNEIEREIGNWPTEACPFFFMVGAGVSWPAIPLGAQIIEDCQKRIDPSRSPPADPALAFSWHVEQAFPTAKQRWTYFSALINGKPLSRTNRLLALSLSKRVIGNLLVTTNFDDQIERSLNILGENHPAVIEAPEAVYQLDRNSPFPQILHLHGKFVFQTLVAIDDEIRQRSDNAIRGIDAPNMYQCLSQLLAERSPLVIGYGGGINDVFLRAIRERSNNPSLPPVYWFCYSGTSLQNLPQFILEGTSVRLVIAETGSLAALDTVNELLERLSPDIHEAVTPWTVPFLPAEHDNQSCTMFIELADKLRIAELETVELVDLGEKLLSCYNVLNESDFRKLNAARLALTVADVLRVRDMSAFGHKLIRARALLANGKLRVQSAKYEESLLFLRQLRKEYALETDVPLVRRVAGAHFYESLAVEELGQTAEYEALARDCVGKYNSHLDPEILGYAMMTACNLAIRFREIKSPDSIEEAQTLHAWIGKCYPGPLNLFCIEAYYKSLVELACMFEESGKPSRALSAFEKVVSARDDIAKSQLHDIVLYALTKRASIMAAMHRFAKAGDELRRLGRLLGREKEQEAREQLAEREIKVAETSWSIGIMTRLNDLVGMVNLCGEDPSPKLRQLLARSFRLRCETLFQLRRFPECVSTAKILVDRFGHTDSVLKLPIAAALSLRARAITAMVSAALSEDRQEDSKKLCRELIVAVLPMKDLGWPSGAFWSAFAHYTLGELYQATKDAVDCARSADEKYRSNLFDYLFPHVGEDTPQDSQDNLKRFWEWFQELTKDELPIKTSNKSKSTKNYPRRT